ncbi:MAG: DUF6089 family protein [Bacteroidia bacterium]|nr:DUF6089 family protein [Bacteroidia bacterium]
MKKSSFFDSNALWTVRFGCILMLLYAMSTTAFAQRSHMLGAGVGTLYYYGDLSDIFVSSNLKPAGSITYQKYLSEHIAFRGGFSLGQIAGTDAAANDNGRILRDLSFKSTIGEIHAVTVYEFFQDKYFGNDQKAHHLSPYVFGGMAMFFHNPKGKYEGEWHALQPLGTEGQFLSGGKGPYSRVQLSFPMGLGMNLRLTANTGISAEIGYRFTMTDYLDDVSTNYPDFNELLESSGPVAMALSTGNKEVYFLPGDKRGNPEKNDGYMFMTMTFNYYLSRFK